MSKNSPVSCFMTVFMSYCPHYRVPCRFAWSIIIPLTCLRKMTRKSSFSHFMAVLMSYCPLFRGSREIYNHLKNGYKFESYEQQLVGFVFYGRFRDLLPTFFGFHGDLRAP